jgi:hypothetical protein
MISAFRREMFIALLPPTETTSRDPEPVPRRFETTGADTPDAGSGRLENRRTEKGSRYAGFESDNIDVPYEEARDRTAMGPSYSDERLRERCGLSELALKEMCHGIVSDPFLHRL